MRVKITESTVKLWLSKNDTYVWAHRPGAAWPCSWTSGHRLFAEFDSNGLVDFALDGDSDTDEDANEFNAITSDHLRGRLPKEHPIYAVAVGQFDEASD